MKFATFCEDKEREFEFYKNLILNFLGLDPKMGLSQSISTYKPDFLKQKLSSLGEFAKLPQKLKSRIYSMIEQKRNTTFGEIIRMISDKKLFE